MRVKFFGLPNQLVKSRRRKLFENVIQFKPLFRFDNNGEYICEDETLIEKIKLRFDYEVLEEENSALNEQIDTLESIAEEVETKALRCKHCEFETDNKGLLMSHYRIHKKEV